MRTDEFMLYRNMEDGEILSEVEALMEEAQGKEKIPEEERSSMRGALAQAANQLLELAVSHGFTGNLWQAYLTWLMVNDENAYSRECEVVGEIPGGINEIALHDFTIFKELFDFDFEPLLEALAEEPLSVLLDYEGSGDTGDVLNAGILDRIQALCRALAQAEDAVEFKDLVTQFYKEIGVGKFGLHKAFRLEHDKKGLHIVPITKIMPVSLDDLVGYEIAKQKLVENTEAFVHGRNANNCLLFGAAGTGKSTSIKAILNQYYGQGLRMIEVYKHQAQDLNDVIDQIKNRHYKFIIYMDDLSFEEFETDYKYLKAVIEGGLEKKPDNVLIYATSNRRHLIKESAHDRDDRDSEMHSSDTVQEKLSLSYRFGVNIYFGKPDPKEFQEIVRVLAKRNGIQMPEDELLKEANQWEISHGGYSGRTAQQFIDYLAGKEEIKTGD